MSLRFFLSQEGKGGNSVTQTQVRRVTQGSRQYRCGRFDPEPLGVCRPEAFCAKPGSSGLLQLSL